MKAADPANTAPTAETPSVRVKAGTQTQGGRTGTGGRAGVLADDMEAAAAVSGRSVALSDQEEVALVGSGGVSSSRTITGLVLDVAAGELGVCTRGVNARGFLDCTSAGSSKLSEGYEICSARCSDSDESSEGGRANCCKFACDELNAAGSVVGASTAVAAADIVDARVAG